LLGHHLGEARAVDRALVGECLRERDRLAVVVETHEDGHVLLRPGRAEVHAVDQAVEHVRHVELAVDELVAHAGPRRFLGRHDLDAVLLVEAEHRGHHHRGAVGERDEADPDLLLLGLVGALRVDRGAQAGQHAGGGDGGSTLDERAARGVDRRGRVGAISTHGNLAVRMDGPRRAHDSTKREAGRGRRGEAAPAVASRKRAAPSRERRAGDAGPIGPAGTGRVRSRKAIATFRSYSRNRRASDFARRCTRAVRGSGQVEAISSAACKASSTVSSHSKRIRSRTSAGMSSRSRRLRAGSSTVAMPARCAASTFSLTPPIGSTSPRRLISPVIATSLRTGRLLSSEVSATNIATPALGPSFGVAPAGTWTWMSALSRLSRLSVDTPSDPARALTSESAACALSFMTSP